MRMLTDRLGLALTEPSTASVQPVTAYTAYELPISSGTSDPASLACIYMNMLVPLGAEGEPVGSFEGIAGAKPGEPEWSSPDEFFAALAEDYDRLRADPVAWKAELDEEEAWDASLDDGLIDE